MGFIQTHSEKVAVAISVVALTAGGYYLIKTWKSSTGSNESKLVRSDPQGCRDIIKGVVISPRDVEGAPPQKPLKNFLEAADARARPNHRLIHAFGINNCFTTDEKARCAEFKKKAKNLVDLDDDDWMKLSISIRRISVEQFSQTSKPSLFDTIQLVTMKAALDPLVGVGISDSGVDQEISQLAREINKQWLNSKQSSSPETAFAVQSELVNALHTVVPAWDGRDSKENPLNFILPGYETLWRVVLRCFIEVVFRSTSANEGWRRALEDFSEHPTNDQLNAVKAEYGEVSACMVVEEALRLYPPTRRIYREFETEDKEIVEAAADIEACHRDKAIWGERACEFDPTRWLEGSADKDFKLKTFMPFGARPFACVAKQSTVAGRLPFGVAMIAVLVGALSIAAGDDFALLGGEDWEDGRLPLKTDREAYGGMFLQRVV